MEERYKPWVIKHSPKEASTVVGQDSGVVKLKEFVLGFKNKKTKKKAMLLYGPTGSGKTSAVHAIGKDLGYEVVEVNASDTRNADAISSIIGEASKQMSLFCPKGKIILVDEIDGVAGRQDRGGISQLKKIIEKSSFPIVMTANDPFGKKFSALRKKSEMLEFELLDFKDVHKILKSIVEKESIEADETALKMVARRAGGDARAAVNDLQILSSGDKKLTKEDVEILSDRERKEEIQTALTKIFKTTDPMIAKSSFYTLDEDLKECLLWVDENLPKEYSNADDLARAYQYVSKADVMNRRIMRWQHWRFMAYVNDYLSAGVAVSKEEKYKKIVDYKRTKRLLTIWLANRKYQKRLAISEKIAEKTHGSKRQVVRDTYPYIKAIFKKGKDKGLISEMIDEFELGKDEVEYLKK